VTSTRKFVWSGTQLCEYRNANGSVQLQIFAQGQYQSSAAYFYMRDHLGSIREMTDAGGTVVARYDYDPWGRSTTVIGTNKPDFNFTGLYQHAKSGLDMAVYRFYDPDLGRWLSRDPIGEEDGANLYQYVHENPVNLFDLFGLRSSDYPTEEAASRAGAQADYFAVGTGSVEYGGYVCRCNCNHKFYYTGPVRGHDGHPPATSFVARHGGANANTWSDIGDWEQKAPCDPGDARVGAHYGHPNGSLVPPVDASVFGGRGLSVGVAGGHPPNLPTIRFYSNGH
jgi:RHS repeat-associated protein